MYMTIGEWENTVFMFAGATLIGHRKAMRAFRHLDVIRTWSPTIRPGEWIVGGTQARRREVVPELDSFLRSQGR